MTANKLVPLARNLRRNQTSAESKLWSVLRNRQVDGLKFRRQHPIGRYIADFCCEEIGLIIELDGSQHADATVADAQRTMVLEDMKYTVLRFWNFEHADNIDGVVQQIHEFVKIARNPPSPSGEGRGPLR
jgi:very-short-patch-repair endonuclease